MKTIKYIMKFLVAGLVAFTILCGVTAIYNLTPLRVKNEFNNTDYAWEAGFPWMKMTEGISCGVIDDQGFNNIEVIDNPDILLLGSSHMEAMNVQQTDNTCSILNEKFAGEHLVYNMSISGHTFFKVVQYLPKSLSVFENVPKYIIIETSTTVMDVDNVSQALNGEVEVTTVNSDSFIAQLQRFPFLRQVYHQLDSGMMDMLLPEKKEISKPVDAAVKTTYSLEDKKIDEQPYQELFEYLSKLESEYKTEIIVMYHPFETLNEDGSISFIMNEYTSIFSDYSNEYNIDFVDMTSDFEDMYYKENRVPHGFATGELGVGHINKYGHKAIANRLFTYICELEEGE